MAESKEPRMPSLSVRIGHSEQEVHEAIEAATTSKPIKACFTEGMQRIEAASIEEIHAAMDRLKGEGTASRKIPVLARDPKTGAVLDFSSLERRVILQLDPAIPVKPAGTSPTGRQPTPSPEFQRFPELKAANAAMIFHVLQKFQLPAESPATQFRDSLLVLLKEEYPAIEGEAGTVQVSPEEAETLRVMLQNKPEQSLNLIAALLQFANRGPDHG